MNPLAVTAITDFLLAGEVLFFARRLVQLPKQRGSAAWYWSAAMTLLGLAALIGGIDHGFIEMWGLERFPIQRANWLVVGAMTGCVLMTAATQFTPPRLYKVALAGALLQFGLYAVAVFLVDSFYAVVVNYVPVMLLLLALSMHGLRRGRGSWPMIAGIAIQLVASGVQASGFDAFIPFDHNGLYHLISMVGVVFLFRGGRSLDRAATPEPVVDVGIDAVDARGGPRWTSWCEPAKGPLPTIAGRSDV